MKRIAGLIGLTVCFTALAIFYFTFDVDRDMYSTAKRMRSPGMINGSACIRIETLDPAEVPGNRSIFFIESTREMAVEFTARQACSVESAARINPDRLVYVLFLSPMFNCQHNRTAIFALLANYRNIRFRHIELQTYTDKTPFQDFIRSGIMDGGNWPVEQHSDMLRLLTLWKFGGIYMDLDVVSLKQMPLINFIGAEYPGYNLASHVIGMQSKDVAERAIEMFIKGWDGENWAKNGPLLLTNLMKEKCGFDDMPHMYSSELDCNNFTVYPSETFGPIAWYDYLIFFDSSKSDYVKDVINSSMAIHFWNNKTKNRLINLRSSQPYANIANENCPKVVNTVTDYF